MKFGKQLLAKSQKEWVFYSVDYKDLKKCLKPDAIDDDEAAATAEFFRLLDGSERKLNKFYSDKESWAKGYMHTLEERVADLRSVAASTSTQTTPTASPSDSLSTSSVSSNEDENMEPSSSTTLPESPTTAIVNMDSAFAALTKRQSFGTKQAWLKEEYRRMGSSKEFKAFIYAKKSLATFSRELALLLEFLDLNKVAFSKILKKFDKRTGSSVREEKLAEIYGRLPFLEEHQDLKTMKEHVDDLIDEVNALKPQLPEGWENRKVYTIGCFDLFHRGHQNVLLSLREFGYYVVAGIHDDASYYQLKKKNTIDNLETRIENVKPFVDQIFVIPSTDPLPYIRAMVSQQDIAVRSLSSLLDCSVCLCVAHSYILRNCLHSNRPLL